MPCLRIHCQVTWTDKSHYHLSGNQSSCLVYCYSTLGLQFMHHLFLWDHTWGDLIFIITVVVVTCWVSSYFHSKCMAKEKARMRFLNTFVPCLIQTMFGCCLLFMITSHKIVLSFLVLTETLIKLKYILKDNAFLVYRLLVFTKPIR